MSKETGNAVVCSEKVIGTLGLEHALYQNSGQLWYDEAGKKVLSYKEVLANILKYAIPEYSEYSVTKIMSFIEDGSISNETPIGADADTRIIGENTVQSSVNEANLTFDVLFSVLKPEKKKIHIHIDVELQGNYYPGYPLEKRGIYNLSRMISSQLDVVNKKSNYNKLEKAYCIFICVGGVPQFLKNTISYYGIANKKNIGKVKPDKSCFDLMDMVIIRLGESVQDNVAEILKFLHGIFYNIEEVREYIDFSKNEALREEIKQMSINGEHLIEYGMQLEREKTEKELAEIRKSAEETVAKLKVQLEESNRNIQLLQKRLNELEAKQKM